MDFKNSIAVCITGPSRGFWAGIPRRRSSRSGDPPIHHRGLRLPVSAGQGLRKPRRDRGRPAGGHQRALPGPGRFGERVSELLHQPGPVRPGSGGEGAPRRRELRRRGRRRGQDRLHRLFLHQHRQALSHRPPVHHHDRPRPEQDVPLPGLQCGVHQPPGGQGTQFGRWSAPTKSGATRPRWSAAWTKWCGCTCSLKRPARTILPWRTRGGPGQKDRRGGPRALEIFEWFKSVTLRRRAGYDILGVKSTPTLGKLLQR